MTVILNKYVLPDQKGAIEIRQVVTVNVTAVEARRMVRRWLSDEVAFLITATEPTLVVGEDKSVWRVPAVYAAPHVGQVGEVGAVDVDIESGALVISDELKESILQKMEELAATLPLYEARLLNDETAKYVAKNYEPTDGEQSKRPLQEIIDAQKERMAAA